MRPGRGNSFRFQMMSSIIGVFLLLVLSTAYILFSTITLQERADTNHQKERQLHAIGEILESFRAPLLEYLSTRSSTALGTILRSSQELRDRIPPLHGLSRDADILREDGVHALIRSFLAMVDTVTEEKRRRNITGYIDLHGEMSGLLQHIGTEIDSLSTRRFRSQLDSYGTFITSSRNILFWNLLFIIFVSLFSILLLLRSVEKMSDPLVHLAAMATELSGGNFGTGDIELSRVQEIDQVVGAFNRMKHDIHRYIEEIRRQENLKQEYMQERLRNMKMEDLVRRMEVYTLQAHMNPHFLFNTLNTGLQLAILEKADRTGEYMEHLAKLFRHNIRHKETMVPLRHEIEGLRYYFYILEVRFPKTLQLTLDCPEELLDSFRVPVSLLQPLVENCVVHAFGDRDGQGSIRVRASGEESGLVMVVEDNGRGMDGATIQRLLSPLPLEESHSRVMGLENVIQRLYFYYPGDRGVIRIESGLGSGTAITIRIAREEAPCIAS